MSYVVHLWQQPVPASLAQAEASLRSLRQQLRFEPDPGAGQLLAAIEAGLPPGHAADDCWTETPEADGSQMVLSLSPVVAELGTVLPAIEAAARQCGWVLFDPQAGEVRLPSGQVLDRAGSTPAVADIAPSPDLDTSPAARKTWLHQSLGPIFTRHGWCTTRGEFCFSKNMPFGRARVYSQTSRQTLNHAVWLSLKLPTRLQPALDSDGGPHLLVALHHQAGRHGLPFSVEPPPALLKTRVGDNTYQLPFGSTEQAMRRRDELAALYDGHVLDWLDTLNSLNDLEHWANRVPDADCPFVGLRHRNDGHRLLNYHPDLLLAAAVEAPDFEQRARERFALYEADAFGRSLLPQLRALLAVCGLNL